MAGQPAGGIWLGGRGRLYEKPPQKTGKMGRRPLPRLGGGGLGSRNPAEVGGRRPLQNSRKNTAANGEGLGSYYLPRRRFVLTLRQSSVMRV